MKGIAMRHLLTCLMIVVAAWGVASCTGNSTGQPSAAARPPSQTATQIFSVQGVVKELKPDSKTVVIQHEDIPNYMRAMTMPFEVKNTNELAGLGSGDQVTFRLLVTETDGWIDQVRKLGSTNAPEPPPRDTFRRVRFVEPLNIGDALPDYGFTNELGRAIHLAQFKGQALAFTFLYTRCPLPNFCPRMSSNFADAAKRLAARPDAPTNWHLVLISFDPEHDTPEVLKNYAKRYPHDTNHWDFATGALIDIDAITEQFGLMFPREGAIFNHNLRTVVVDARGNVQKVFTGNEWKADDLVAEIVKGAGAK
jgi:protein SCO1/2